MAKCYAFPLLAFVACWFYTSDSFAGDLKDESTLIKNSTNSDTIYSNSDDASQEKIHPLDQHYKLWIENLQNLFEDKSKADINSEMSVSEIESKMTLAFQSAYEMYPHLYREPIVVGGLTYHFLHGMTPQKDTPRRKDNLSRLREGKPGIFVDPRTNEIVRKELHHVQQNSTKGIIAQQPRDIHKANHGILHPFTVSRIDKNDWAKDKRISYKSLNEKMHNQIDDKQNNPPSNGINKRKKIIIESPMKFKKQKAA